MPEKAEPDTTKVNVLLALLHEQSAAMRECSQPEYLFTAGAVAAFGAVCWGVAALTTDVNRPLTRAALIAAISIFFTAIAIIVKVLSGHENYGKIKRARADVAKALAQYDDFRAHIPEGLLNPDSGPGAYYSAAVIFVAAVGAIGFCLVVAYHC